MISESIMPPFSAPKQPKAAPEHSVLVVVSSVTIVSGQCTIGVSTNESSWRPRLSVEPFFTSTSSVVMP